MQLTGTGPDGILSKGFVKTRRIFCDSTFLAFLDILSFLTGFDFGIRVSVPSFFNSRFWVQDIPSSSDSVVVRLWLTGSQDGGGC